MSVKLTLEQITQTETLKLDDQLRVLSMVERRGTHVYNIIETTFRMEFCQRMIDHQKRLGVHA
jgi:hypothetical protein